MQRNRPSLYTPCYPFVWRLGAPLVVITVVLLASLLDERRSRGVAEITPVPLVIATPQSLVAYGTTGDTRDVDIYPALAYASVDKRFLLVWLTLRNATAQSDGFDLYGQYFDQTGQPSTSQFRISDSNTVARSSPPVVVSSGNNFVALWTVKGAPCRLAVQPITDSSNQPDQLLELGLSVHQHSPQLLYDTTQDQYIATFVAGDDYLPPLFSGASLAEVANCGNAVDSKSEIRAATFHFENALPQIDQQRVVSVGQSGAFRPTIAFNSAQSSYFVVWEDRRNHAGLPYRFDVYGQRLSLTLAALGDNLPLATGTNYNNNDNSATWTPRPHLVSSDHQFLATWFEHTSVDTGEIWTVESKFITAEATSEKATLLQMSFGQTHPNAAPSGFLTSMFDQNHQEFLIGVTSHLESFAGYFPTARMQRMTTDGKLLRLDGTVRSSATAGDRIDTALNAQFALAITSYSRTEQSGYLLAYSKNMASNHERDYDIWGSFATVAAATITPTVTTIPLPTLTSTPTPLPGTPYQQNLPLIRQ